MKKSTTKTSFESILIERYEARKRLVTSILEAKLPDAKKQFIDDLATQVMFSVIV